MNPHLTNEQLFELLNSATADADHQETPLQSAVSHLALCAECRCEFDSLHSSLSSFRTAATSFAEQNAPIHPPVQPIHSSANTLRIQQPLAWAAGLLAAAALCTAGVSVAHKQQAAVSSIGVTAPLGTPTTAAAAEDATLLEGIDRDLSTSVPPSLQPLDVTSAAESTSTTN